MKRKAVAVWMTAFMLSLGGATMSAMAAEGWVQSGSSWTYNDSNGNRVYDDWKKGADNLWRYLDENGVMAVNSWVDSDYYVDSNGIMLTDKWLKLTDEDGNYEWYYFGSSGKKIDDTWKKIDDKWYHFDDDGRMELGWILDDMYYTGTDGVMRTGWQKLIPPDDYDEDYDKVVPGYDSRGDDDGTCWFYFGTNGKKYVPTDENSGSECGTRKVEGYYYCFDMDGAMKTGWQSVRGTEGESIESYMYFGSDGKAKIGWYSIEPPEDLEGYEGDVEWFYFTNSGKPKASDTKRLSASDITKINGKSYLFNHLGNPVYGLKKVYTGGGEDSWTAYYFGDKEKSCIQKGKMKVVEDDGNKSDFYFSENGRGYTGNKDGYLYYKGKMQKAMDGEKYVCIRVEGNNYVVNSSGKIMKNTTVRNSDGVKLKTNSSGHLVSADDDTDVGSYATEPYEPVCAED